MEVIKIQTFARDMRKKILDVSYSCNKSVHIGGALSMVEILATLYSSVLKLDPKNPCLEDRDRFILSKGHGALAYYAALLLSGFIPEEIYSTFQSNESDLTTHPVMNMALGIESSNGSLGQGLSMGVGLALAAQQRAKKHRVFVMLGDGECNEGSVWEAAMAAPNFKLENLTAIIDLNGFQNDGSSASVMEPGDFIKKWESFGWNTLSIEGHSIPEIYQALVDRNIPGKPKAIIAKTVKGKGCSFMENKAEWHHSRLTQLQYERAIQELEAPLA